MLGTWSWVQWLIHWGCGNLLTSNRKHRQWSYLDMGKPSPSCLRIIQWLPISLTWKRAIAVVSWPSSLRPTCLSSLLSLCSSCLLLLFLQRLLIRVSMMLPCSRSGLISNVSCPPAFQTLLVKTETSRSECSSSFLGLFSPWHLVPPSWRHCRLRCSHVSPFRMQASRKSVFCVFFSYISSTQNIAWHCR